MAFGKAQITGIGHRNPAITPYTLEISNMGTPMDGE